MPALRRAVALALGLWSAWASAEADAGGISPKHIAEGPHSAESDGHDVSGPPRPWYEGLDSVKVLRPEDPDLQSVVDDIWKGQESWEGHFNERRFVVILTRGEYPPGFVVPVSYYTSVHGAGAGPEDVSLDAVRSMNGPNGQATNNFWRSVEGVTLRAPEVTWAVSQGAPMRRSIVHGHLYLSDGKGYSSGGFLADVAMKGTLMMGTQQQWLFRNMDTPGGVYCPQGWNYVFVGVTHMADQTYTDCEGIVTGKVTVVGATPRVAEKPYLVHDEDSSGNETWSIYVPAFMGNGSSGATRDHAAAAARKLDVDTEVFVATPGHSAEEINAGARGKRGLLLTPGTYTLSSPIVVDRDHFVVLGLGFSTLISTSGRSALRVAPGLRGVRIAGILLEAGTPKDHGNATEPLLRWGDAAEQDRGAPAHEDGGVLSDVFARIGSFRSRGCPVVRTDTMLEINSDGVVLDNAWLWHADHDDCGTDPGNSLDKWGKSDECFSKHALVVNGRRATAYGIFAEHIVGGDMVSWRGEAGESYLFQSELPYHSPSFSKEGFVAYAVSPEVRSHSASGMGVYIIGGSGENAAGFRLPSSAAIRNLMTVVVIGDVKQFAHTVCTYSEHGDACLAPSRCFPASRCVLSALPSANLKLFDAAHSWAPAEPDPPSTSSHVMAWGRHVIIAASPAALLVAAIVAIRRELGVRVVAGVTETWLPTRAGMQPLAWEDPWERNAATGRDALC